MKFLFMTLVTLMLAAENRSHEHHPSAECRVEFRIENAGIEVSGIFEHVSVEINFDERKLDESTIIAKARPKDIRTGIPIRDKHLQKSDYFHTDKFPEITLTSTLFKKIGRYKILGTFTLTIKGFRKEITIPFNIVHEGNATTYSGSFEINRLDFGLGEESLILDKRVKVFLMARIEKEW
jgi:polyisoprenoid-binding protein YceI